VVVFLRCDCNLSISSIDSIKSSPGESDGGGGGGKSKESSSARKCASWDLNGD